LKDYEADSSQAAMKAFLKEALKELYAERIKNYMTDQIKPVKTHLLCISLTRLYSRLHASCHVADDFQVSTHKNKPFFGLMNNNQSAGLLITSHLTMV
jgi:hypothetical protein